MTSPSRAAPLQTRRCLEGSTIGGQSWSMLPPAHTVMGHPPLVSLQVIPQARSTSQTGWAVVGSRLYRATDGGRRRAGSLPAGTVVNLSRVPSMMGFAVIHHGRRASLYRTRDGGVHWFRVS